MAKINQFIASYRESMTEAGLPDGDVTATKKVVRRFLNIFKEIDDKRIDGMIDYPLEEIILITFLAVLGNASTWTEIEHFGLAKEKWLKKFLKLKNGIPSHDTFRRVFGLIDKNELQNATVQFLLANLQEIKKSLKIKDNGLRQICVDGKEQKGTGRKYKYENEKVRNLQTLHVYDASNEICLYSEAISEKTNEIPVARKILSCMDLKNCVVTFDALHTQKETIDIIAERKGDYVGGLKGNQPLLQKEAEGMFTDKEKNKIKEKGTDYYQTVEKSHNQIERRCYYLKKVRKNQTVYLEWKKLRAIVCFEKHVTDVISGEETVEIRYYMTSLTDVETAADAIRGHWGIENKLHWHLDYSFGEDDNTTMDKTAFNNLSLLNKMVLALCRLAQPMMGNISIRMIRKDFGWGFEDNLMHLLSCFDAETVRKTLENA